jgi:alkanesulfonate monooxygenase SsuD/methylene tetrahydromethanopterin reductase-like flavin-dependent oxidoreductase (luciferase family)
MAVRLGVLLPTRDRAAAGDDAVRPFAGLARRAEAAGFDSVWAGDSPLTRPRADALVVLAAAAAVTTRVMLGTAVLLPALRHPVLLAHQLATLDRLAEGRLVVGVGAGFPHRVTEAQFAALGVGYADRAARLEEAVGVMRRVWRGDADAPAVAPRPCRPEGPPVWAAGGGAALPRVARFAAGWLPYPPSAATYAAERSSLAALAPGPVTAGLYATVCLDDDPARARERLRASVERYYGAPLEYVASVQAMFAGSAAGFADWVAAYVAAGAEHVVVRLAADDHDRALDALAAAVLS